MTDRPTEDEMSEPRKIIAHAISNMLGDETRQDDFESADVILAALRAAGLVVVPMEPTEAMADVGASLMEEGAPVETVYAAMIETALPAPPATGGEG